MTISLVTFSHGLTVGDLISRTTSNLYGLNRTALNQLEAAITSAATTLTMSDSLDGLRAGSTIEVDDEEMYVRSTNSDAKTAVVRRGMNGTTAAAHLITAMVRVEPRFSRSRIMQTLRAEIASWPGSVYARYTGSISVGSTTRGVDAAGLAGIEGAQLITVQRSPLTSYETVWPTIPNARLVRRQATASFPSGYSVEFPNYGGNAGASYWNLDDSGLTSHYSAFTGQVRVKAPFSTAIFSSGTDVGQVMGMPLALAEIAPIGAAARLVMTRDIPRTDSAASGRSRPGEEVRVGDATSTARSLLAYRDQLLSEVARNLYLAEEGFGSQT